MNILYIHGFKSHFKEQSSKVQVLNKIGKVFGITLDYTKNFDDIKECLGKFAIGKDIDLVVGTSLGGYYSAIIGARFGIPFVAINPVIDPVSTLSKYVGDGFTFGGEAYTLEQETILTYLDFPLDGYGLILLDRGDDVINPEKTKELLEKVYQVKLFEGGSHRFEHINESLDEIKSCEQSSFVYGFNDDEQ